MSLTSQIKDKNSSVRQFFTKFEHKEGMKECLALLQSTQPIQPPAFTPAAAFVYAVIGTAADYLIRYTANGNSLSFKNTIAHQALDYSFLFPKIFDDEDAESQDVTYLDSLYKIGKHYLDGRDATDHKAIYSATALAVMDGVYRSSRLPKLFHEPISKSKMEQIQKFCLVDEYYEILEKSTWFLFDEYYESLGGDMYAQDISGLIRTFITANKSSESEFFDARFAVFNQELKNSRLVSGADFDCIIECDNRLVLTDIKTTINPLTIDHLRQIIGYALLYDPKKDNFKFTDIGIYHSRSGSFRFLQIDNVIEKCLPNFKSVSQAREAFISEVKLR